MQFANICIRRSIHFHYILLRCRVQACICFVSFSFHFVSFWHHKDTQYQQANKLDGIECRVKCTKERKDEKSKGIFAFFCSRIKSLFKMCDFPNPNTLENLWSVYVCLFFELTLWSDSVWLGYHNHICMRILYHFYNEKCDKKRTLQIIGIRWMRRMWNVE